MNKAEKFWDSSAGNYDKTMAKRTPAFERVHVNIELLGVYFPRISQNPSLLDVRAWENLSEENKKGFPVDVSRLLEEPKEPLEYLQQPHEAERAARRGGVLARVLHQ